MALGGPKGVDDFPAGAARVESSASMDPRLEEPEERPSQRVAVIIPCFNEATTIEKVVRDFAQAVPEASIYVFDNNSTDGTGQAAERAGAIVVRSRAQGKGNVFRHAASEVDADIYVIVDGDDTYSADAAPAMVERLARERLDMLVGTRLDQFESRSFRVFHQFGNRLISRFISLLFGMHLTDVLSGYRVLSGTFMRVVRVRRGGFELETELTLQALTKRLAVAETPVAYAARPEGSHSKLSTWGDGWLILKCIGLVFKDYRPLLFFSAIAFLLAVAGLVVGSVPIRDFIEHRYVFHVPRAILAAALGILATISLTAGLILDTVVRLHEETVEFWKRELGGRR